MHETHKFLIGSIPHLGTGMMFEDIVASPDNPEGGIPHDEFEGTHDLIQWLFPTMTASKCQPQTPVLTWEDVTAMHADEMIPPAMVRANQFMRRFYSGPVGKPRLLAHRDHNHLRITRVIESLSLLHSPQLAQEFLRFINQTNSSNGYPVNMDSVVFWNKARFYGDRMRAINR